MSTKPKPASELNRTETTIDASLSVWNVYDEPRSKKNAQTVGSERLLKLFPDAFKQLCELIAMGASDETAAQALGILPVTFKRWVQEGLDASPNSRRAQFSKAICKARNRAIADAEIQVKKRNPLAWLKAQSRERWHDDAALVINNDNRRVSFNETPSNADLARTLAVLEQLGAIPSTDRTAPADAETVDGVLIPTADGSQVSASVNDTLGDD